MPTKSKRLDVPEEHYIIVSNLTRAYDLKRSLVDLLPGEDVPEAEVHEVGAKIAGWIERMQTRLGQHDR